MTWPTLAERGATHKLQIFQDSLLVREVYGFNNNEPFQSKADVELYQKNEKNVDALFHREGRREYVIQKIPRRRTSGVLD